MKVTTMTAEYIKPTMEALSLPIELFWDGKLEPTSPPSSELFSLTETSGNWLYDDNFANGIQINFDDDLEEKPTLDLSQELLNGDLAELYHLKDEHWNKLPTTEVLLEYPIESVITSPTNIEKVQSISFDIDALNSAHILPDTIITQLTPPHSPTHKKSTSLQNGLNTNLNNHDGISTITPKIAANTISVPAQQQSTATVLIQNINFPTWNDNNGAAVLHAEYNNTNHNDDTIAIATQIIDDIVKTRAEELCFYNEESESQSSYSQADSMEWLPDTSSSSAASVCSSSSSNPDLLKHEESGKISGDATATPVKKRTRPYGRGIEDRKIRKKEQNKNAATRYRQKKKLEMETVLSEEQILTQRNDELKEKYSELKREASYLKKLIRELYSNKKSVN